MLTHAAALYQCERQSERCVDDSIIDTTPRIVSMASLSASVLMIVSLIQLPLHCVINASASLSAIVSMIYHGANRRANRRQSGRYSGALAPVWCEATDLTNVVSDPLVGEEGNFCAGSSQSKAVMPTLQIIMLCQHAS
jgi:hypothetical protein